MIVRRSRDLLRFTTLVLSEAEDGDTPWQAVEKTLNSLRARLETALTTKELVERKQEEAEASIEKWSKEEVDNFEARLACQRRAFYEEIDRAKTNKLIELEMDTNQQLIALEEEARESEDDLEFVSECAGEFELERIIEETGPETALATWGDLFPQLRSKFQTAD